MKVAFFSPLPSKKTGIAVYSQHLSAGLSKLAEIHFFEDSATYRSFNGIPVADFAATPQVLAHLGDYDVCLYHLGNNPWHHLEIYKVFLWHPGIVDLHDTVLYYLIAGMEKGGFIKEFCLNYGVERLGELKELLVSCPNGDPLRYPNPERYAFLKQILSRAPAIIVHSETSKKKLQDAGYERNVYVIDLLSYGAQPINIQDLKELRSKNGIAKDEIVIGCFGFISFTKRLDVVVQALLRLKKFCKFKLLIVGEGDMGSLQKQIKKSGLAANTVLTGFVEDEDFARYLASADIVVNLRYPNMGEASATLIQAFSYGKACVVTNHAWFAELPDNCVQKINVGEREVDELAQALHDLSRNPSSRKELGERARAYAARHCQLDTVAQRYVEVFEEVRREQGSEDKGCSQEREHWASQYLLTRTKEAIPR